MFSEIYRLFIILPIIFVSFSYEESADVEDEVRIPIVQHVINEQTQAQNGVLGRLWDIKESLRKIICCHSDDIERGENTPLMRDTPEHCHWGLYHWGLGIKEYFERCLCSAATVPDDVSHITVDPAGNNIIASDCLFINPTCNNPILGTICCPFLAMCHLCRLPFDLCNVEMPDEESRVVVLRSDIPDHTYPYGRRLPGTFG